MVINIVFSILLRILQKEKKRTLIFDMFGELVLSGCHESKFLIFWFFDFLLEMSKTCKKNSHLELFLIVGVCVFTPIPVASAQPKLLSANRLPNLLN